MRYGSRDRSVRQDVGVTLIEVLVAISVLGALLSVGAFFVRPAEARLYANDVRALVQQARFEAVRRNEPVAVVWDDDRVAFLTVLGTTVDPCDPSNVLNEAEAARYRRVEVDIEFDEGLLWLPSGYARSCALGPLTDDVIATISDDRSSRTVTVTITGRVTIE